MSEIYRDWRLLLSIGGTDALESLKFRGNFIGMAHGIVGFQCSGALKSGTSPCSREAYWRHLILKCSELTSGDFETLMSFNAGRFQDYMQMERFELPTTEGITYLLACVMVHETHTS